MKTFNIAMVVVTILVVFGFAFEVDAASVTPPVSFSTCNYVCLNDSFECMPTADRIATFCQYGTSSAINTIYFVRSGVTLATVNLSSKRYDVAGRLISFSALVNEQYNSLNHSYAMNATIASYNALNQILSMSVATIDGSKSSAETDVVNRVYDSLGKLIYAGTITTEMGASLNHTYLTYTAVTSRNSLGKILRMNQTTVDSGKTIMRSDTVDKAYDSLGRPVHSKTAIMETGAALNNSFTKEITINGYNFTDQVTLETDITINTGKTIVETDASTKIYDALGRLIHSKTVVSESGSGLNHIYSKEAVINSYNSLGQILMMTQITVDGSKAITQTDMANRCYDMYGRLISYKTALCESGPSLNHTYTQSVSSIMYNTLGQLVRLTQVTADGSKTITQTDMVNKCYDMYGRLISYSTALCESGPSLNHAYTQAVNIGGYNTLGQLVRVTQVTVDGTETITQTDIVNRCYDMYGRLSSSNASLRDTVNGVTHSYTQATSSTMYNSSGQVVMMSQTTLDGNKTITQVDASNRMYDMLGRLIGTNVYTVETTSSSNLTYTTATNISQYNTLSQVLQMMQMTKYSASSVKQVDLVSRVYDILGKLYYGLVRVYQYDANGNLVSYCDKIIGSSAGTTS